MACLRGPLGRRRSDGWLASAAPDSALAQAIKGAEQPQKGASYWSALWTRDMLLGNMGGLARTSRRTGLP